MACDLHHLEKDKLKSNLFLPQVSTSQHAVGAPIAFHKSCIGPNDVQNLSSLTSNSNTAFAAAFFGPLIHSSKQPELQLPSTTHLNIQRIPNPPQTQNI